MKRFSLNQIIYTITLSFAVGIVVLVAFLNTAINLKNITLDKLVETIIIVTIPIFLLTTGFIGSLYRKIQNFLYKEEEALITKTDIILAFKDCVNFSLLSSGAILLAFIFITSISAYILSTKEFVTGWKFYGQIIGGLICGLSAALLSYFLFKNQIGEVFKHIYSIVKDIEKLPRGLSIFSKLVIAFLSTTIITLLFLWLMMYQQIIKAIDRQLIIHSQSLLKNLTSDLPYNKGLSKEKIKEVLKKLIIGSQGASAAITQDGEIIAVVGVFPNQAIKLVSSLIKAEKEDVIELREEEIVCFYKPTSNSPIFLNFLATKDYHDFLKEVKTYSLILFMVSLLLCISIAYFSSHSISNPIKELVNAASSITKGDLTAKVYLPSDDEVGILGWRFNLMTQQLREVIEREKESHKSLKEAINTLLPVVRSASDGDLTKVLPDFNWEGPVGELASAFSEMITSLHKLASKIQPVAREIAITSLQLAELSTNEASGAEEQASAIAEITATMEELARSSFQIAENTNALLQSSERNVLLADKGEKAVMDTMEGMKLINEQTHTTVNKILELSQKSKQIGNIVEIINEIADQTKLLAFNAAIEAARAGEVGKAFSVVAAEIRKLAENVVNSTREIKELIEEILSSVNSLAMGTEKNLEVVEKGKELSEKAQRSLQDIIHDIKESFTLVKEILNATKEQKIASDQVVDVMKEISEVVKQTADNSRSLLETSQKMKAFSQELIQEAQKFKV